MYLAKIHLKNTLTVSDGVERKRNDAPKFPPPAPPEPK